MSHQGVRACVRARSLCGETPQAYGLIHYSQNTVVSAAGLSSAQNVKTSFNHTWGLGGGRSKLIKTSALSQR